MEEIRCKHCNKVLGEADFTGVIKKKCPKCGEMNIYVKRLGGIVYTFLEKEEN